MSSDSYPLTIYYDETGRLISGYTDPATGQFVYGVYNEQGTFVHGFYGADGSFTHGYYLPDGTFRYGYVDDSGNFVAGYTDAEGNWVSTEDSAQAEPQAAVSEAVEPEESTEQVETEDQVEPVALEEETADAGDNQPVQSEVALEASMDEAPVVVSTPDQNEPVVEESVEDELALEEAGDEGQPEEREQAEAELPEKVAVEDSAEEVSAEEEAATESSVEAEPVSPQAHSEDTAQLDEAPAEAATAEDEVAAAPIVAEKFARPVYNLEPDPTEEFASYSPAPSVDSFPSTAPVGLVAPAEAPLVAAPGADRPRVGAGGALSRLFRYLFHFSGRASKSEFWWAWGIITPLLTLVAGPLVVGQITKVKEVIRTYQSSSDPAAIYTETAQALQTHQVLLWVVVGMYALLLVALLSAVTVRRLHDTGMSGAFYLTGLISLGFFPLLLCLRATAPIEGLRFDTVQDASRP